jgi:hypothetical protein
MIAWSGVRCNTVKKGSAARVSIDTTLCGRRAKSTSAGVMPVYATLTMSGMCCIFWPRAGGGALELALNACENVLHGGGGGHGKSLVTVDVVVRVEWIDGGRHIVLTHVCTSNRIRGNGAPRSVDDVGYGLVDGVFVRVVDRHSVMQGWVCILIIVFEGRDALFLGYGRSV